MHNSNGNLLRTVQESNRYGISFRHITSFDTNTIAVSTCRCISIVNIDTHELLHKIKNGRLCYGITHSDGKLYCCSGKEGIRRFDLRTKSNQLLVPTTNIREFVYILCDGNNLFYTSITETVSCCDMNGKQIWRYKDTSLLRSPRGVVVDNESFVFVADVKSGNILEISPDGISSKEVDQMSSPIAMCYDKNKNENMYVSHRRQSILIPNICRLIDPAQICTSHKPES